MGRGGAQQPLSDSGAYPSQEDGTPIIQAGGYVVYLVVVSFGVVKMGYSNYGVFEKVVCIKGIL